MIYQHPAAPSPLPHFALWDKWVDASSPNAQCVLKSMVPCVTSGAVILAKAALHRQMNIASLIRDFIYKGYPRAWCRPAMHSSLASTQQLDLVSHHLMKKWVREGPEFGTQVCKDSGT